MYPTKMATNPMVQPVIASTPYQMAAPTTIAIEPNVNALRNRLSGELAPMASMTPSRQSEHNLASPAVK